MTVLYYVSTYDFTVTGWFCTDEPDKTVKYHAVQRVLDPTSISKALTSLAETTSADSGTSTSLQVGIGVGVGLGVPILILGSAIFFWWWRLRRKRIQQQSSDTRQSRSPEELSSLHANFLHYREQGKAQQRPVELPPSQLQEMESPWNRPELSSSRSTRENRY